MPQRARDPRTRRSRPADPRSLHWHSPARDLWVATEAGEYAGMAEFVRSRGYRAFGPTGRPLGCHRTLGAALTALEATAVEGEPSAR